MNSSTAFFSASSPGISETAPTPVSSDSLFAKFLALVTAGPSNFLSSDAPSKLDLTSSRRVCHLATHSVVPGAPFFQ